jgi:hypothetical protein
VKTGGLGASNFIVDKFKSAVKLANRWYGRRIVGLFRKKIAYWQPVSETTLNLSA